MNVVAVGPAGIYSIGAVARIVGVPAGTLRSWEDRYGVVVPERTEGDQRLFTRDHLEQLRFVCQQIGDGLSAADAHRALSERLTAVSALEPRHDAAAPRILLVERDPFAAELADYFLRTEGYDVALTREVAVARDTARDGRPVDLVILDLLVGGGAGFALCEELGSSVPVVALSALDHRDRALAGGAHAFLRKPIDPLRLVSVTRDLLRTSALAEALQRSERS